MASFFPSPCDFSASSASAAAAAAAAQEEEEEEALQISSLHASPESALELTQKGGALLVLQVPPRARFGLDLRSWAVGPRFQGVKMIPAGAHLVFATPPPLAGSPPALPAPLWIHLAPGQVHVLKWVDELEGLQLLDPEDEQTRRYVLGVRRMEFDGGQAPYPLEAWREWHRLTCWISPKIIEKIIPLGGELVQNSNQNQEEKEEKEEKEEEEEDEDQKDMEPSRNDDSASMTASVILQDVSGMDLSGDVNMSSSSSAAAASGKDNQINHSSSSVGDSNINSGSVNRSSISQDNRNGSGQSQAGSATPAPKAANAAAAAAAGAGAAGDDEYASPSSLREAQRALEEQLGEHTPIHAYTSVPQIRAPKDASAAEITQMHADQSTVLESLLKRLSIRGSDIPPIPPKEAVSQLSLDTNVESEAQSQNEKNDISEDDRFVLNESEKHLLGELQHAFSTFLVGQSFDGFAHWKSLLRMLCSCDTAIEHRHALFYHFASILAAHLRRLPTDFFVNELSAHNFVRSSLRDLHDIVRGTPGLPQPIVNRMAFIQQLVSKRFSWNVVYDDMEEEYAAVVVAPEDAVVAGGDDIGAGGGGSDDAPEQRAKEGAVHTLSPIAALQAANATAAGHGDDDDHKSSSPAAAKSSFYVVLDY